MPYFGIEVVSICSRTPQRIEQRQVMRQQRLADVKARVMIFLRQNDPAAPAGEQRRDGGASRPATDDKNVAILPGLQRAEVSLISCGADPDGQPQGETQGLTRNPVPPKNGREPLSHRRADMSNDQERLQTARAQAAAYYNRSGKPAGDGSRFIQPIGAVLRPGQQPVLFGIRRLVPALLPAPCRGETGRAGGRYCRGNRAAGARGSSADRRSGGGDAASMSVKRCWRSPAGRSALH